jgi:transposase, IS6 family
MEALRVGNYPINKNRSSSRNRLIKKITKPMLDFKSLLIADQTLKGIEAMHMIRKGQAEYHSTVLSTIELINKLFGIVA